MGKITPFILILFACLPCAAEKITVTTTDGQTIADAEISRITPDGLTLITSDGIRKLGWASLPAEIKKKYAATATETGNAELARMAAKITALEQENASLRLQLDRLKGQTSVPLAASGSAPSVPAVSPAVAPAQAPMAPQEDTREWDRNALSSKLEGGTRSGIKALLGPPTGVSAYSDGGDVWSWDGMNIIDRKSGVRFRRVTVVFSGEEGTKNPRGSLVNFY